MYKYEYAFIAHQGLSDGEVTKLMGNLSATLEGEGAKIIKQEYWGLLNLAYKINKQEKGHYFMLCVETGDQNLSDFKKKLKLNELVLRYLELRRDTIPEGESQMIKIKDGEDEKK